MDHKYIRLDQNPGAVINTDKDALEAYRKKKALSEQQKQEVQQLKTDMSEIKSDMSEIKNMLNLLLQERLQKG